MPVIQLRAHTLDMALQLSACELLRPASQRIRSDVGLKQMLCACALCASACKGTRLIGLQSGLVQQQG
jgi:hypothetical protein